jgi:histidinol-phosphate aminotransferase
MPVYDALLRQGVIVRPIGNYGLTNHLRVTIGTAEDNQAFIDALDRVLAE